MTQGRRWDRSTNRKKARERELAGPFQLRISKSESGMNF
jgi:hypothetical protein